MLRQSTSIIEYRTRRVDIAKKQTMAEFLQKEINERMYHCSTCNREHCYHFHCGAYDFSDLTDGQKFKIEECSCCRKSSVLSFQDRLVQEFIRKRQSTKPEDAVVATGKTFFSFPPSHEYLHVPTLHYFTSKLENPLKAWEDHQDYLKWLKDHHPEELPPSGEPTAWGLMGSDPLYQAVLKEREKIK